MWIEDVTSFGVGWKASKCRADGAGCDGRSRSPKSRPAREVFVYSRFAMSVVAQWDVWRFWSMFPVSKAREQRALCSSSIEEPESNRQEFEFCYQASLLFWCCTICGDGTGTGVSAVRRQARHEKQPPSRQIVGLSFNKARKRRRSNK